MIQFNQSVQVHVMMENTQIQQISVHPVFLHVIIA